MIRKLATSTLVLYRITKAFASDIFACVGTRAVAPMVEVLWRRIGTLAEHVVADEFETLGQNCMVNLINDGDGRSSESVQRDKCGVRCWAGWW